MNTLTNPELRERLNDHRDLATETQARLMKSGCVDANLLAQAGLNPDPALVQEPHVRVDFDHMSLNVMLGRGDPIYRVYEHKSGRFIGHFAAAAFIELKHCQPAAAANGAELVSYFMERHERGLADLVARTKFDTLA